VPPVGGDAATLLLSGTILITGGASASTFGLNAAGLYDPAANAFTALSATMTTPRVAHTATLLSDGKVLITGGAVDIDSGSAP
jgi:N-acetylneuraminic acid mutarotase